MPLQIDSVVVPDPDELLGRSVTPGQNVSTSSSAAAGGPQEFAQVQPVLPTPIGVSEMPPEIGAGVELARLVLYIAAGSIIVLTAYLIFMDIAIGRDIHNEYKQVLNPSRIGAEFYTLGRLEELSVDLGSARKDPQWQMSVESRQNADSILKMVGALPSITSAQKTQLNECVPPPPANASRNDKLDRCIGTIESIRGAALEAAAGATNAQVAGESAGRINEHRQSLHTFWIQAAQLILLNLLLPLLTALLGYVFGTQRVHRTS
jgi:hypothetical protein